MASFGWKLNGFERLMFKAAFLIAGLAVAARLASLLVIAYIRHSH